jgi:hypothetical protein
MPHLKKNHLKFEHFTSDFEKRYFFIAEGRLSLGRNNEVIINYLIKENM